MQGMQIKQDTFRNFKKNLQRDCLIYNSRSSQSQAYKHAKGSRKVLPFCKINAHVLGSWQQSARQ